MKNGTEEVLPTETQDKIGASAHEETMSEFLSKVAVAQASGEEWVETSPEIINYINRKGLGGSEYFTYGNPGVKVCEYGKSEAIEKKESEQIGHRTFGKEEGTVLGR